MKRIFQVEVSERSNEVRDILSKIVGVIEVVEATPEEPHDYTVTTWVTEERRGSNIFDDICKADDRITNVYG